MSTRPGKQYNYKIANLRALAILVVAFGHSSIIFDGGWNYYTAEYTSSVLETVKHAINLFQMPLFVFISGYCFYYSREGLIRTGMEAFLCKKAKRLLIPFVCFALLWMIPLRLFSHYPYWKGLSLPEILLQVFVGKDSGHLWFCPALFLIMLLASAAEKHVLSKRGISLRMRIALLGGLYGISVLGRFIPGGYFFINDVLRYTAWFYLGYHMNWRSKESSHLAVPMFLTACLLTGLYVFGLMDGYFAVRIICEYVCGILLVSSLFFLVPRASKKVIMGISKNSFGIYLFHSPMLYIVFSYFSTLRPYLMVLVNFVFLGALSYALTESFRRTKYGRIAIGE